MDSKEHLNDYQVGDLVVFVDSQDRHVFEIYEYRPASQGVYTSYPMNIKMISIVDAHEARAYKQSPVRRASHEEIEAQHRL